MQNPEIIKAVVILKKKKEKNQAVVFCLIFASTSSSVLCACPEITPLQAAYCTRRDMQV